MPPTKRSKLAPQCVAHDQSIRLLQEQHLETHSMLKEIHGDMQWIRKGVSVNGSRGLENILRDQHELSKKHTVAIAELREVTAPARASRQLSKAWGKWVEAHPTLSKLVNSATKRAVWVILSAVAGYFGIAEILS